MQVLYFANFCDMENFAKLSTTNVSANLLGEANIRYSGVHTLQSQTLGWVATSVHVLLFFLLFLPFLFFLPVARNEVKKVTFWCWSWPPEIREWNLFLYRQRVPLRLHDAECYMTDCTVNLTKTTQVAATLVYRLPKLQCRLVLKLSFGLVIAQNLAWLHEIAKINIRKIVTIAKSQNIVLANNSIRYLLHRRTIA